MKKIFKVLAVIVSTGFNLILSLLIVIAMAALYFFENREAITKELLDPRNAEAIKELQADYHMVFFALLVISMVIVLIYQFGKTLMQDTNILVGSWKGLLTLIWGVVLYMIGLSSLLSFIKYLLIAQMIMLMIPILVEIWFAFKKAKKPVT